MREGLRACLLRWIFFEPLCNARHILLEISRDGEIENTCPGVASVFEVVSDPARHEYKRPFGCVSPNLPDQQTHGAFDDVKNIILWVRVSTRALRIRFQPPLRNGIARFRFRPVGFENRTDSPHRIGTAFVGAEDQCFARRRIRRHASLRLHPGEFRALVEVVKDC